MTDTQNAPDIVLQIARRAARHLAFARLVEWAAVCIVAAGLAAVVVQAAGIIASASRLWTIALPLAMLGGGAVVGAFVAIFTGRGVLQAAAVVDRRRGLSERFATAVHLARRDTSDPPVAQTCCRQAMDALGQTPLAGVSFFRRTRRTAGALALVLLMLVSLAVLSELRRGPLRLDEMTFQQRAELAAAFRRGAGAADREAIYRTLAQAALAVEMMDQEELDSLIEQLRREGVEIVKLTPRDVNKALGLPDQPADIDEPADDLASAPPAAEGETEQGQPSTVSVYDPHFTPPATAETPAPRQTSDDFVPYEDAWAAARRKALANIQRSQIPPEYRQILRRYFAAE